jgi:hypothetical protein
LRLWLHRYGLESTPKAQKKTLPPTTRKRSIHLDPALVTPAPALLLLDLKFGIEHTIQKLTESKFTTNPWSPERARGERFVPLKLPTQFSEEPKRKACGPSFLRTLVYPL